MWCQTCLSTPATCTEHRHPEWTNSTIVLNWLITNPRRFKTFVGNRVSCIVQSILPDHWNHVCSSHNPADCASQGLFPSELTEHRLWWNGPEWLQLPSDQWPSQTVVTHAGMPTEERDLCHTIASSAIIPLQQISSFTRLKHVTAWVLHFINNCRQPKTKRPSYLYLSSVKSWCLQVSDHKNLILAKEY